MQNAKLMGFAVTTDAEKAKEFYGQKLGLELVGDDGYALVFATGTNLLRLQKMKEHTPLPFTVRGLNVYRTAAGSLEVLGEVFNPGDILPTVQKGPLTLVDIVELKWMLAGEGLHVHVEKLQSDPCYARECLLAAERSENATVRQVASKLRARLDKPSAD